MHQEQRLHYQSQLPLKIQNLEASLEKKEKVKLKTIDLRKRT